MAGEIKQATDKLTTTLRNGRDIIEKHGGAIAADAGFSSVFTQLDTLLSNKESTEPNLQVKSYKAINTDETLVYPDSDYDGLYSVMVSTQVKNFTGNNGMDYWDAIAPPEGSWQLIDCNYTVVGDYIFGWLYYDCGAVKQTNSSGASSSTGLVSNVIFTFDYLTSRCAAPTDSYAAEVFYSTDGKTWERAVPRGSNMRNKNENLYPRTLSLATGINLRYLKIGFGHKMETSWPV
jgi:hypothetical protein